MIKLGLIFFFLFDENRRLCDISSSLAVMHEVSILPKGKNHYPRKLTALPSISFLLIDEKINTQWKRNQNLSKSQKITKKYKKYQGRVKERANITNKEQINNNFVFSAINIL